MLELLKYKNLAYLCIYVCYSQSKSGVRGPEACVEMGEQLHKQSNVSYLMDGRNPVSPNFYKESTQFISLPFPRLNLSEFRFTSH